MSGFRMVMIQTALFGGGMTESIFPEVEAWLQTDGDHFNALRLVARRKKMDRYHSIVDFLFCEMFVEYQSSCRRFYDDDGPMLKDLISTEQIAQFNTRLLRAMEIAYAAFCEKREMSWTAFRKEVFKIAA